MEHLCDTAVLSSTLVGCASQSHCTVVMRSGDLTSVQQSLDPSASATGRRRRWRRRRRRDNANPASQSSQPAQSAQPATLQAPAASAPSGTNVMECAVQICSPLVIDATKKRKREAECKKNVWSVVDSIIGTKCEHAEVVRKRRYRNRSTRNAPQTVEVSIIDTPSASICEQRGSQREDDSCSVISLGSDDEVEIIDREAKPRLGCRSTTGTSGTPPPVKPETVTIDLCSPSMDSKVQNEKVRSIINCKVSGPTFKAYVSLLDSGLHTSSSRSDNVPSVTSHTACQGIVPLACPAPASSGSSPAVNSGVESVQDCEVIFMSSTTGGKQTDMVSVGDRSLESQNCNDVRKSLQPIDNQMDRANGTCSSVYGNNYYNPHPNAERLGLRPVVIDGSNVAMGHGNGRIFSCRGLQICIDYFLKRSHRVVAFVPLFRRSSYLTQDAAILDSLEKQGLITFTPSRRIGNQLVVPYDDRYIVQYAADCGGVIVSTDNYRDLLQENPAWRETIENRLLMFTWVGDVLMFPQDPLGRHGPNLESFLRFPQSDRTGAQ